MEDFFALSKEEAPDNIPMMFITMPSSKDPEAKKRHPGTTTLSSSTAGTSCQQSCPNVLTEQLGCLVCVLLTGKSCMTILTMVKYEWFEEWKDTTVRKRGDEYHNYKMRFAKNLFEWACTLFPKIKNKVCAV